MRSHAREWIRSLPGPPEREVTFLRRLLSVLLELVVGRMVERVVGRRAMRGNTTRRRYLKRALLNLQLHTASLHRQTGVAITTGRSPNCEKQGV
jgi:hypothetical protein